MSRDLTQRPWARGIRWDIVLAAIFGAIVFAGLVVVTDGILISLAIVVACFAVWGVVQYLLWGHAIERDAAPELARAGVIVQQQRAAAAPAREFAFMLTERERAEVVHALEQWSAAAPAALQPHERAEARTEVIRGVLDRLRGFGA